ncbi:metal ABC transporter permease [Bacteroidales bacterium]|nr:metal ABC transporter permease [Bacteroidales bacterium]
MLISELFTYTFLRHAFFAAIISSIMCGIIGTYIVTRRMVFIGGGITHASFGGIGIGYFLGMPPLLFAIIFATLSAFGIEFMSKKMEIRNDSAIAVLWALGMAIGIIFIHITPGYSPNLMSYLFGSILSVTPSEINLMLLLLILIGAFVFIFAKPILFIAFDESFARTLQYPVNFINYSMLILSSLVIVSSIKIVGIILLLSLITIPQNIANLFTDRFYLIMLYSAIIAVFGSITGLVISYFLKIPSGAAIIFTLIIIYGIARLIKKTLLTRTKL